MTVLKEDQKHDVRKVYQMLVMKTLPELARLEVIKSEKFDSSMVSVSLSGGAA